MLNFVTVTREFRSLVARRRDLLMFLGSVFAAMGLFLRNVLEGNLPEQLARLERHAFAFYAVGLLVPSLLLALRLGRLHAGMVLNGIFYAHLMHAQTFRPVGIPPQQAARLNWFSASFLSFVMADCLCGFAAVLLLLALGAPAVVAGLLAVAVSGLLLAAYLYFHRSAKSFGLRRIESAGRDGFSQADWQSHLAGSLEDTNHDMIALLGFVGLITFSVFETLSGLGRVKLAAELTRAEIQQFGPAILGLLLFTITGLGLVAYLRLRVAVGRHSLELDPSDRPFRPLRLTDSLLGYMLLAFLFGIGTYLLAAMFWPKDEDWGPLILGIAAMGLAILAEQVILWRLDLASVATPQLPTTSDTSSGSATSPTSATTGTA